MKIGDLVEYHGSKPEYHGTYVVARLPLEGERGYILKSQVSNGVVLGNVHRRSLSLLESA